MHMTVPLQPFEKMPHSCGSHDVFVGVQPGSTQTPSSQTPVGQTTPFWPGSGAVEQTPLAQVGRRHGAVGQTLPQAPQLFTSLATAVHVPLQRSSPEGQAHRPLTQVSPSGQH
jgi:hypothetical protein